MFLSGVLVPAGDEDRVELPGGADDVPDEAQHCRSEPGISEATAGAGGGNKGVGGSGKFVRGDGECG